ncbi:MAG: hypothetical protein QXJ47_06235 [Candidatus Caldarchaeum sp.]
MALEAVKIWEIRLRLESPLILTRRRTETGFLNPLRYIPSTTLRGALVTALYREGILDAGQLGRERRSPEVVASPAYPISHGYKTFPAHPFIGVCKQCGENVGVPRLMDLERYLVDGDGFGWRGCSHRAWKFLHPGEFLPIVNGEFRVDDGRGRKEVGDDSGTGDGKVPVEISSVSVGISKSRASGVRGLLYHYEALSPGLEYWATVAVPESFNFPRNGFVLYVGRGVSRGFGRVKMSVVGERRVGKISPCRVLYAFSPTINLSYNGEVFTFPRSVDLSWAGARLGLKSNSVVKVGRVFGRMMWISLGWDLGAGAPRPWVVGRAAGSLIVLEEACGDDALGALSYLGTVENLNGNPLPGFNMMMPLQELMTHAS